jgi:Na+-translocating ferredoxin:NAD+ oxidoreductase RnfE subunit
MIAIGDPDSIIPYLFRLIRLWPQVSYSTTSVHQLSLRLCSSLVTMMRNRDLISFRHFIDDAVDLLQGILVYLATWVYIYE